MRWKDRFKNEKKLVDQFVVIVNTAEQLLYVEDRRRSDIHPIAPREKPLSTNAPIQIKTMA
jgi:hypothetical protein